MRMKYFGIFFLMFAVTLPFSNCASNFEPAQYQNSLCPEGNCTQTPDGQMMSLSSYSDDVWMRCFQNSYQIGGICNQGDYKLNFLRYSITRDGFSETNSSVNARCENGRFYMDIRRPADANAPASSYINGYVEYRLNMQMFSANSTTEAAVGGPPTVLTVKIQWPTCTLTSGL